jgi:protocatechuate 3,4-dioxygenase beta subunit
MNERPDRSQGDPADDRRPSDGFQIPIRRREMMALSAGTLASVALYGCGAGGDDPTRSVADGARTTPDCVLTPEQDEGPFYIDLAQVRQDIREGRPGVPLALAVTVVDANTCEPIHNAAVDVWHCDALGLYSGEPTEGSESETFLRGIQLTDKSGQAEFATIYPGQYPGRTTHIHLKVHTGGRQRKSTYAGGHVSHTGQLFTTDQRDTDVFALAPYDRNPAEITPRDADFIYREQGGSTAVLHLTQTRSDLARGGLTGRVTLGVNPQGTTA